MFARLLRPASKLRGVRFYSRPVLGKAQIPPVVNEPFLDYKVGSPERAKLAASLERMKKECPDIPCVVGGKEYRSGNVKKQLNPSNHSHVVATYHGATEEITKKAIDSALETRSKWSSMPWNDRAAIFLKAADLLSTKYRADMCAAMMIGSGKNVWQAEIDAAVEIIDFWRFNVRFADELYNTQPAAHAKYTWNRSEYRPLEGFVFAVSPFNFAAIGAQLPSTPAMLGNVVLWKPASTSVLANWVTYQILLEAGLPPGVIQFLPGEGRVVSPPILGHRDLSGLSFTGSTGTFNTIWRTIGQNLEKYRTYPRIVGETGGKNFHFAHPSADVNNFVNQTLRAAFEYQGQKCSACSRAYVPDNLWPAVQKGLLEQVSRIKLGQPEDFTTFMCGVIDAASFKNIKSYIEKAKANPACTIIAGGKCDDSKGYFVEPTIIVSTDPKSVTMCEEIFGPVLTIHVYPKDKYVETLKLCDQTSPYALTGALFSQDRYALEQGADILRDSAGNFYMNDKSTGAVVGQQPFGGARQSGTNDKAGSPAFLHRWVSARTIKESFLPISDWKYPHMEAGK